MKYFIDLEFSEMGPKYPIVPISVAIVAEDGREFYAINSAWYGWRKPAASEWVKKNVLTRLPRRKDMNMSAGGSPRMSWEGRRRMSVEQIATEILEFVDHDPNPEFWGYYADYDWVVFCQLFGTMVDLPKGWPMYCRDLKQIVDERGNPKLPDLPDSIEHHALYDALETKMRYDWLMKKVG